MKSAFAKFTINDDSLDNVGAINFASVTVTVLFKIEVSASSICPVSFECLNGLSKFFKLELSYALIVSFTKASKPLFVCVVEFESYAKETPNIKNVVSASTITGVTDDTLYFFKSVTN